ncbi:hypothetical protein [Actinokineospora sp. UTMC 2448]|uniref:hypothetical protein n=1 Tax=Actinokineospora sp. UTMC 2448 TaxID=2268449 RepID=UPI0021647BAE|nr:hypothetical protein [Actinokineospora sp. UTMC 2448]UVS81439.1 hypothetical protein Actkin_05197 [Actinokineospora sp. UTMC 2448]
MIDELSGLQPRLMHRNDTSHAQHTDFANRAKSLANYLDAGLTLTKQDLYGPAFATLRTALEHVSVDYLAFLGQRYVQLIDQVDEATWAQWQERRATGQWPHVIGWTRTKKGRVTITFEGLRSDSDDYIISIYYFLLNQYQPNLGPPSIQQWFNDGLSDADSARTHAEENELIYRTYLTWRSIKENLLSNGFYDEAGLKQLDVHYRFLSMFTHPLTDTTRTIYGRNTFRVPSYDHYSSELCLLYIITLATLELRRFKEATERPPQVDIAGWAHTESLCNQAWNHIVYLWFPGHEPHHYDYIQAANHHVWRNFRSTSTHVPPQDPRSILAEDVNYYRDPLTRLIALHQDFHELTTGLAYRSPWPRPDARYR